MSKRRGMLIKNTNDKPVRIQMTTRLLNLIPGEEQFITADEVKDSTLRESLQIREISIVRPATPEEESELKARLAEQEDQNT